MDQYATPMTTQTYATYTTPVAMPGKADVNTQSFLSAEEINKNVKSNKVGWTALFLAGLAVVLVFVLFILYAIIPAPPTLRYSTVQVTAGSGNSIPNIIPSMNTLYSVTAPSSGSTMVKFVPRTSGYTLGVIYYVTNSSASLPITVQTTNNSFNLEAGRSSMMYVDANGNSHKISFQSL